MILISMKKSAVALVAMTTALTACATPAQSESAEQVVVGFYALEYVTQQLVTEDIEVVSLTSPGTDAHDAELTPQQIADLSQAELVVYLAGFQPAVDDAIAAAEPARVVEVGELLGLDNIEHDHDASSEDHAESSDPHFWLDPTILAELATPLAAELAELHPAAAGDFEESATNLRTELTQLDSEIATGLSNCDRRDIVTSHASFHYFAEKYGLIEHGIVGSNPNEEATAARLAELQELITQLGLTTVFTEPLSSNDAAEVLASDLNLELGLLDPVEGITAESPGDSYPEIMRSNLAELRSANGCS